MSEQQVMFSVRDGIDPHELVKRLMSFVSEQDFPRNLFNGVQLVGRSSRDDFPTTSRFSPCSSVDSGQEHPDLLTQLSVLEQSFAESERCEPHPTDIAAGAVPRATAGRAIGSLPHSTEVQSRYIKVEEPSSAEGSVYQESSYHTAECGRSGSIHQEGSYSSYHTAECGVSGSPNADHDFEDCEIKQEVDSMTEGSNSPCQSTAEIDVVGGSETPEHSDVGTGVPFPDAVRDTLSSEGGEEQSAESADVALHQDPGPQLELGGVPHASIDQTCDGGDADLVSLADDLDKDMLNSLFGDCSISSDDDDDRTRTDIIYRAIAAANTTNPIDFDELLQYMDDENACAVKKSADDCAAVDFGHLLSDCVGENGEPGTSTSVNLNQNPTVDCVETELVVAGAGDLCPQIEAAGPVYEPDNNPNLNLVKVKEEEGEKKNCHKIVESDKIKHNISVSDFNAEWMQTEPSASNLTAKPGRPGRRHRVKQVCSILRDARCNLCGVFVNFTTRMISHLTTHIDRQLPRVFRCAHCNHSTSDRSTMLPHLRSRKHIKVKNPREGVDYLEIWDVRTVEALCAAAVHCIPEMHVKFSEWVRQRQAVTDEVICLRVRDALEREADEIASVGRKERIAEKARKRKELAAARKAKKAQESSLHNESEELVEAPTSVTDGSGTSSKKTKKVKAVTKRANKGVSSSGSPTPSENSEPPVPRAHAQKSPQPPAKVKKVKTAPVKAGKVSSSPGASLTNNSATPKKNKKVKDVAMKASEASSGDVTLNENSKEMPPSTKDSPKKAKAKKVKNFTTKTSDVSPSEGATLHKSLKRKSLENDEGIAVCGEGDSSVIILDDTEDTMKVIASTGKDSPKTAKVKKVKSTAKRTRTRTSEVLTSGSGDVHKSLKRKSLENAEDIVVCGEGDSSVIILDDTANTVSAGATTMPFDTSMTAKPAKRVKVCSDKENAVPPSADVDKSSNTKSFGKKGGPKYIDAIAMKTNTNTKEERKKKKDKVKKSHSESRKIHKESKDLKREKKGGKSEKKQKNKSVEREGLYRSDNSSKDAKWRNQTELGLPTVTERKPLTLVISLNGVRQSKSSSRQEDPIMKPLDWGFRIPKLNKGTESSA